MAEPEVETTEIPQEDIDLIQKLKEQAVPPKDIVRQVPTQNYNFPVKTLAEELNLSTLDVGQIKGGIKREESIRDTRVREKDSI